MLSLFRIWLVREQSCTTLKDQRSNVVTCIPSLQVHFLMHIHKIMAKTIINYRWTNVQKRFANLLCGLHWMYPDLSNSECVCWPYLLLERWSKVGEYVNDSDFCWALLTRRVCHKPLLTGAVDGITVGRQALRDSQCFAVENNGCWLVQFLHIIACYSISVSHNIKPVL